LKRILCISTLDTKGAEVQYLKELIEKRGHAVLVLDVGSLGEPNFTPDITADKVARTAGTTIEEVRALKYANQAAEVMIRGAVEIVRDLYSQEKIDGVISVGGGMGSTIAAAAMRELPLGIPKLMLSSQKILQAGIRHYVRTKDIAVIPSVVDIAGLNRLTMRTLSTGAGAIIGMVESLEVELKEKPVVFMTMVGTTTGCGLRVKQFLEEKGFEVLVFHTIGLGGMTFEELLKDYPVEGVVELGLNEIGNELFGGLASAGPNRLEAAGKKGIPQIVAPGSVELINFLGPETVPERYQNRTLHAHNPQAVAMRINAEESRLVAETIARKLNMATGPVRILIPANGFSGLDFEGSVFSDPVADKAFIDTLTGSVSEAIKVRVINAHINDEKFALAVAEELMATMKF